MKKNFCRLKKILSLATFISFIVTNHFGSAYATSAGSIVYDRDGTGQSRSDLLQNISKISIPAEMGKIQELYQAKGRETRDTHAPVVILIQDAHAVPEAQRNIQKLITYFQGQYGVHLIALEGAASELDPQMFKSFPDQEILKKTLDDYMERGEVTGSTAAAIFSNLGLQPEGEKKARASSQAVFQGIEDWNLYKKGLGLYQKAMSQEEKIQSAIHAEQATLQKKKESVYSTELLNLDNTLQAFNANRLNLIDMLKKLAVVQPPEKGTDLALLLEEAGRDQKHQALHDLEVKKIGLEIKNALESSAAEKTDKVFFNEKWQEFQTSRISAQEFAVFLVPLAAKAGLPLQIAGRLSHAMNNQKRMRDIEGTRLFGDFEKYAQSVKQSLFRNGEEKKLDRISHGLELIERMSRLELSREDWTELKELPLDSSYKEFLKPHYEFFKNVEARDEVFYKNVMTLMKEHDAKTSLLVAGGFHTESMIQKFKSRGISYILLTPQINVIPENSHYRERMRGDVSWKDYYEIEDGKVNLYRAFVRGARDRLLERSRQTVPGILLKAWRDQIIRDLAREEKITKVQDYTFFLDELMRGSNSPAQKLNPKWYDKVEQLIQSMRDLETQKQWTEKNILNLISSAGGSALGTSPATHADLTYSNIASGSILDAPRYFP
ncbi:MAG TPA: hypothetical protein VD913_01930, partial [bacterium]|nr:hypothetical protein [bacterium]